MRKNVINDNKDGFSVQEQLFQEILNGFQKEQSTSKKKIVKLSSVQKNRLPKVAESFLRNKKTNGFTQEWVSSLSSHGYIDQMLKKINKLSEREIKKQVKEDEEDVEFDEEKESIGIFTAFKILNWVNTIRSIMNAISVLRSFNTNIFRDLSKEMSQVDNIDGLSGEMKRALMMDKFTKFVSGVSMPLIPVLFKTIKDFYDSEYINSLFRSFEEWLKSTALKEAAISGAIWVLGVGLSKLTASGSVFAAKAATAARWANVSIEVGRILWASYRFAQTGKAILDIFTFDDKDAKKWEKIVLDIRDKQIVPLANTVEEYIDAFESKIGNLESLVVDNIEEKLFSHGDKEGFMAQLRHDKKSLEKLFKLSSNFGNMSFDSSRFNQGKFIMVDSDNRDVNIKSSLNSRIIDIIHEEGSIYNEILTAHSRKWDVTMSDETVERLLDEKTGLKYVNYVIKAADVVKTHFQSLYQNIIIYFDIFEKKYPELLESKINSKDYQKFLTALSDPSGEKMEKLIQNITKKTITYPKKRIQSENKSNVSPNDNFNNVNVWRLSKNTLQPFTPIFINNAFVGFELKLTSPYEREVKIKVPRIYDVLENFKMKDGEKVLDNDNNKAIGIMQDMYTEYSELFYILNKNKHIISDEYKIEKEINDSVTEIFNLVTAKINELL